MLIVETRTTVPDEFFPDHPEGAAFCQAYERARVPDFELGCYVVKDGSRTVAIAPFFVMRLPLNTMMPPGVLKKLMGNVSLKIAFAGHPSADVGQIQGECSAEVLDAINTELLKRAPLISYKGFAKGLPLRDFNAVIGLPVPVLDVKPTFWADLKHKVRTDLKRKLKASASLTWQEVNGLPDEHLQRVYELYRQTSQNADIQFEQLPIGYFKETAAISRYILFFDGPELIGFHQLICNDRIMYCKYIGMDYAKNQQYKLYFALMLQAINICIRDGIAQVDFGVTSYAFKRQLGSGMHETFNYFRHRNRLVNAALKRLSFLLEPSESELR